ncbi:MAG: 30S ribosome-binding factor RbfA [Planctomycetales bacterium]|nr:30S ribosome-binding factor RbfA [Planctomycetales bacterium]
MLFGLRDPRVKNVTVLGAEVAQDLRAAKIFVTVMGDAKAQSLAMHGLNSARGFIQSKVADRLQTKHTPIISFVLDPSVKKSIEISRALHGLLGESASDAVGSGDQAGEQGLEESDEDEDEFEQSDDAEQAIASDESGSVSLTGSDEKSTPVAE